MAGEIVVMEQTQESEFMVIFKYPIATPITYNTTPVAGGPVVTRPVIPTPSSRLPANGVLLLTDAEKAALDNGTMAFEVVAFTADVGLTTQELVVAVQQKYATRFSQYAANYLLRYKYFGALVSSS